MPGWASRCVTPCGPSQPRCGMGSIRAKNIVLSRLANMLEFTVIPEVRAWSRAQRAAGRRDAVVLTIFVNPLQFGPNEDLARYPRDLPRDRSLAHSRQVDALFVPPVEAMYPPGSEVRVTPGPTADRWEGAARPGHFTGVLTVVAKLFHLIEPDIACFGRKDLQQLTLVRRMVRDLNWPIEIIGVPTVREPDGLALSSRNAYLDAAGRQRAVVLSRALQAAHQAYCRGQRRAADLEQLMRDQLSLEPQVQV